MTRPEDFLCIWLGTSTLAGLTWVFSSRPRLFIRVFVARDEWRAAIRAFADNPGHEHGMRSLAVFEFTFACFFGGAGFWLWLFK